MCSQTFVQDLGGVCGVAPNDDGQTQHGGDQDKYRVITCEDDQMRKAAARFLEHVGLALVTGNCTMEKALSFVTMGQCAEFCAQKNEKMDITLRMNHPLCACHQLEKTKSPSGGAGQQSSARGSCACGTCARRMGATADEEYELCSDHGDGAPCPHVKMAAGWLPSEGILRPTHEMVFAADPAAVRANAAAEYVAAKTRHLEIRGAHSLARNTVLAQRTFNLWIMIAIKCKCRILSSECTHESSRNDTIGQVLRLLRPNFDVVCQDVLEKMRQVRKPPPVIALICTRQNWVPRVDDDRVRGVRCWAGVPERLGPVLRSPPVFVCCRESIGNARSLLLPGTGSDACGSACHAGRRAGERGSRRCCS